MGKCIFCGGRANSKEHAWPNWLLKILKRRPGDDIAIETLHDNQAPRSWHGVNAAIQVKNVCRDNCNNGWMRELEEQAKPILSPMIEGTATTLDSMKQLTVATWLTKTTMVFDSMKPSDHIFYNGLDRSYFRQHLMPTDSTLMWLGHYSGTDVRAFTNAKTFFGEAQRGKPPIIKCNVHTMVFGRLVLQILSQKRLVYQPSLRIHMNPVRGPWRQTTLQIWPVDLRSIHWPPSLSFDDAECNPEEFANRFNVSES